MVLEMANGDEEHVNWKGQKANPENHGGNMAASLTCGVEVLENMVFLSNATNFVSYFINSMHYQPSEAANMVTNFMGTSFLLTIFGGFISDAFWTRFKTFIIFCIIELLGLILLTIQAYQNKLQPAKNRTPSHFQAAILYMGLYGVAVGVGGIKATLPAHGADQLDRSKQRIVSTFFNWYFFALCTGGLLASTVMVWIQENCGWNWSFVISIVALSIGLGIFSSGFPIYKFKLPGGSPITRILKVLASAIRNKKGSSGILNHEIEGRLPRKFRFLDNALIEENIGVKEVEETRIFFGLLPIFASTIMMNCCLAQLQTFSVEQGSIMGRTVHDFQIPTQSLTVFPLTIMLSSIPLFELFAKYCKSNTSTEHHFLHPLKRIGLGLLLASASMAVAALVESKRREAAEDKVVISVFWLSWQYILLGVSDMLTLGGMLEFFYSEAPERMRSMCTALAWCSTSMGFFLSSVLVSITNFVTGKYGREWLGGNDLNRNRLDLFYTLLAVMNFLNLLNYIYWAKRY